MGRKRARKRSFGQITKLPSGRYRARYTGPDTALHNAPHTFETTGDAEAWLIDERRLISSGVWTAPRARVQQSHSPAGTFGVYAERWLTNRDLKPRTRAHYRTLLDRQILPTFGETPMRDIIPEDVGDWYAGMDRSRPTLRAHAYSLLRTVLGSAVLDRHIGANPAHIRGAGNAKRVVTIKPATLDELEELTAAMPQRYQLMVLLASWCALRFGELAELRRKDIDLAQGVVQVRRAVVRVDGEAVVGPPKSAAGTRDVAIPPHLLPAVEEHLNQRTGQDPGSLLFPAADGQSHLAPSTLYKSFYRARELAGRPDLRWHDLRHSGAVLAAQTGATLAELMARLGHSTPQAALRYQHAARGRDAQIAAALSALVQNPAQQDG